MKHLRYLAISTLLLFLLAPLFTAADERAADREVANSNLGHDKVALKGYDPVGYFTENKALKGNPANHFEYRGVTYQFATPEHLKMFAAVPERYLPTYGGWCATAMAEGDKVDVDPNDFIVSNGRLFLFYKGLLGDARKKWLKDEAGNEKKADSNWQNIVGKP